MRRAIGMLVALAALAGAPHAGAQSQVTPWDGVNPFLCTLQQVGTGTDFPDPDADPFCVEFDKTHQNVTDLGLVDFISKEPARVAAASPKCFYFQSDHWTGSIVQGQAPETYHWDGHYYFNKATGAGGVYVENFRIAGQSYDPTQLPGFPDEWKPYFSEGRGGVQAVGEVQADPRCATKPNPSGPSGGGGGGSQRPGGPRDICRVPGGRIGRGIGGVKLGTRRRYAKRALGLPQKESARYVVWCFDGGGRLVAALGGRGDRARVALVLTDAVPFDTRGVRPGQSLRVTRRHLRHMRRLGRAGRTAIYMVTQRRRRLFVGAAGGHVKYLAVSRRTLRPRRALRYLRGMPG
jgi:hypothetical protein